MQREQTQISSPRMQSCPGCNGLAYQGTGIVGDAKQDWPSMRLVPQKTDQWREGDSGAATRPYLLSWPPLTSPIWKEIREWSEEEIRGKETEELEWLSFLQRKGEVC